MRDLNKEYRYFVSIEGWLLEYDKPLPDGKVFKRDCFKKTKTKEFPVPLYDYIDGYNLLRDPSSIFGYAILKFYKKGIFFRIKIPNRLNYLTSNMAIPGIAFEVNHLEIINNNIISGEIVSVWLVKKPTISRVTCIRVVNKLQRKAKMNE